MQCYIKEYIYIYTTLYQGLHLECNKKKSTKAPPTSIDFEKAKWESNWPQITGFSQGVPLITVFILAFRVAEWHSISTTPDGSWFPHGFRCWLCFCRWQYWGHRQARIQRNRHRQWFFGDTLLTSLFRCFSAPSVEETGWSFSQPIVSYAMMLSKESSSLQIVHPCVSNHGMLEKRQPSIVGANNYVLLLKKSQTTTWYV